MEYNIEEIAIRLIKGETLPRVAFGGDENMHAVAIYLDAYASIAKKVSRQIKEQLRGK